MTGILMDINGTAANLKVAVTQIFFMRVIQK